MNVFSLNVIKKREGNLNNIIPNILKQADILYINLIGFDNIPKICKHKKIKINNFKFGGSELRFFNYNDYIKNDTYYFTIDDDIIYPDNYSDILIENMLKYNNDTVCCVHGSNVDLSKDSKFYEEGKTCFHFKRKLLINTEVLIPGVGTSCFYTQKCKINIKDFKVKNMSDVYVASFLYKQNIKIISIKREEMWLKPLPKIEPVIWKNNPYKEIDNIINKTFK